MEPILERLKSSEILVADGAISDREARHNDYRSHRNSTKGGRDVGELGYSSEQDCVSIGAVETDRSVGEVVQG